MSYVGPTQNLWRIDDVAKRFRMLLQGGVYLSADLAIAGTTCQIGQAAGDRSAIPSEFFRARTTPVLCTLERQSSSGSSTLTTDDVSVSSIPAFAAAGDGTQVTLATGPPRAYTTALNSRIRLRTHPVTETTSPPPVVKQGYVDLLLDVEQPALDTYNFPMLAVQFSDVGYDPDFGGNNLRAEAYAFTCTWIRRIVSNENIDDQLIDDVRTFMEMIDDDNYLGGGVEFSEPMDPTFEPDDDLRVGLRTVARCDVIHFGVQANRGEIRNKFS